MNDVSNHRKRVKLGCCIKYGLVTKVNHPSTGEDGLGEEHVAKVLKGFGLTDKEAEVYVFLAKQRVLKGTEIAKRMRMHKAEAYRFLKSLQSKGLVESTLESPARFVAVPFATALDLFVKAKRDEAALIESARKDLLSDWEKINRTKPEIRLERFVVIEGSNKIYPKIFQMMKETKCQLSVISTVQGLLMADKFGLIDAAFKHVVNSQIQFRFLTELSEQDVKLMKTILKRKPKTGLNFKGRTPDLGLRLSPRMVIRDEEEILFFITPRTNNQVIEQEDVCLWTNCEALVQAFSGVFEEEWHNSADIQQKITEVETGKPTLKTCILSNAEVAKEKYDEIMHSAKKEVMMITSTVSLIELEKNIALLKDWARKGVFIKIMAPIVSENLKTAQQLSEFCYVKHVPMGYLNTTIIDGQSLFQFKNPTSSIREKSNETYFEDTFFSTDIEYVEKTRTMLQDIWKNALTPSTVQVEHIFDPPTPKLAPDSEFTKDLRKLILYTEDCVEGIITEKDVINKIRNAQRINAKDPLKDVAVYYGSHGVAFIHPKEHFNLPESLYIDIAHYNKQSTFGAMNRLIAFLYLEANKIYTPVALVADNPEAVAFLKAGLAGTPAAQNCHLVKKNMLQARVQGNTLFAGWTIPIPLFPSRHILPPACLLFEAYGDLKTKVMRTKNPSGWTHTLEQNIFNAFVTLFHPVSKYTGPATEGKFGRDFILTSYPPPSH